MLNPSLLGAIAVAAIPAIVDAQPQHYGHGNQWNGGQGNNPAVVTITSWYTQAAAANTPTTTVTQYAGQGVTTSVYSQAIGTQYATVASSASSVTQVYRSSAYGSSGVATPSASSQWPQTNTTGSSSSFSGNSIVPSPIRGVNLGGWLVLEQWMTPELFANTPAKDQYTYDTYAASNAAALTALQNHWDTFITESDIATMASWGINAVRIPIGYWAYDNTGTPYVSGADAYLEKAVGWCRNHGIKVLVDCHGSPGSQNGFDNSGQAMDVNSIQWQQSENMQKSIDVLVAMAKKYGSTEYADVVFGLEIVNEPVSWGANTLEQSQTWAKEAYAAVKNAATNENLIVVMHDAFEGASSWLEVGADLNQGRSKETAQFWIDTHLYQNQVSADSELSQNQHIAKACAWATTDLLPASDPLPVMVGEFSAGTNICAYADGTIFGSTNQNEPCAVCTQSTNFDQLNGTQFYKTQPNCGYDTSSGADISNGGVLYEATAKFVEAQMETFEAHSQGFFLWSYNGCGGAWELTTLYEMGLIGIRPEDRKYPSVCSGSTSGSS